MEIQSLGDSALVVRLFRGDPGLEDRLDSVRDARARIVAANLPGVRDVTAAYGTIALFYDPAEVTRAATEETPFAVLASRVSTLLTDRAKRRPEKTRLIEIPVCYEPEFGPDLEEVARHTRLTPEEVVVRHAAARYRVNCIGFTPGFPYLSGLPMELATPRRATPRTQVAAGSVAIGGAQAGIYPTISPGGWNVIGRTPRRLFDATREPPARLALGDAVRFRAITRAEFDDLADQ